MGRFSLSDYEDVDRLADQAHDGSELALAELLERFEPAARSIGRRAARGRASDLDDGVNAARWGLVKAVRAHHPGTVGFAAYAKLCMRGEAKRHMNELERHDVPDERIERCLADLPDRSRTSLRDIPELSDLHPADLELLVLHFEEGWSQREIAAQRRVTPSAVSQRIAKVRAALVAA